MAEFPDDGLIARLQAESAELILDAFSADDAWELGNILVTLAKQRGVSITAQIARGEQVLFQVAMEGMSLDQDLWVQRKARTVRRFGVSSMLVGLKYRRHAASDPLAPASFDHAPWIDHVALSGNGGSVPITVRGVGAVATVTVSGLSPADEHALAVEALRLFLATTQEGRS